MPGYEVLRADEVRYEPRGDDSGREVARLSEQLTRSRANLWRYPPGARGRRHVDPVQEEVFVVLDGTLTIDIGEPPVRHELPRGSVAVIRPGTAMQLRNVHGEPLSLYIYGAPPERGEVTFLPDADA